MVRIKPNKSCLLLRQECKINVNIISHYFDGFRRLEIVIYRIPM